MKCSLCDSTALYRVYDKGFCRSHYDEGCKAEAKDRQRRKAWAMKNIATGLGRDMSYSSVQNKSTPLHAEDMSGSLADRIRSLQISDFKATNKTIALKPAKRGRPKKK